MRTPTHGLPLTPPRHSSHAPTSLRPILPFKSTGEPVTFVTQVVEHIISRLRVEHYDAGAIVIQQGQVGRALYIVRSGSCQAAIEGDGEMRVVGRIEEVRCM